MSRTNALAQLRQILEARGIDYCVIPSRDEFGNEYAPLFSNRLLFATGFTGSNGVAVIGRTSCHFFTDGRYVLQAKNEIDACFDVIDMKDVRVGQFIRDLIKHDKKVSIDPRLHSYEEVTRLDGTILQTSPVDEIWTWRPPLPRLRAFIYETKYAGFPAQTKIAMVVRELAKLRIYQFAITDPHSVCWLLNIRARDLEFTPIALCYALINSAGQVDLFIRSGLSGIVQKYLSGLGVMVHDIDDFLQASKNAAFTKCAAFCFASGREIVDHNPVERFQAIKHPREIRAARHIHKLESAALNKLFARIKKNAADEVYRELDISAMLDRCRRRATRLFIAPSFTSIVGFNANGAIVHYHPTKSSNAVIQGPGLLLIDSGGQYFGATTDVTRVIAIGDPTAEMIADFTLVLKAHLAIAMARFPSGSTGAVLDVLARDVMASAGKDYAHGTGHGVGNALSVHEGPHSLSRFSSVSLEPGMIVSIEPGYYREGHYGIRIESLGHICADSDGYLKIEVLTKVALDRSLIDFAQITEAELKWMQANSYTR